MIQERIKICFIILLVLSVNQQIFGSKVIYNNHVFYSKSDSLKAVLDHTDIDTVRINLLNKLSWDLAPNNFEQSFIYADSAKKLAQKINYVLGEAKAYNNLGEVCRYKGDIKSSIENHKNALYIFQKVDNKKGIAETFKNLGISYFNISDFNKSLSYFNRSLKIYENLNDQQGIADNLNSIGNVLGASKKYESALAYFKRALQIFEKINSPQNLAVQNGNIGLIYFELKDYKKSLEYYDKAISVFHKLNDDLDYSIYLGNMGLVYAEQSKFSEALDFYQRSLSIAKKIDDQYGIANQYGNIGKLKLKTFKINKSISKESSFDENYKSAEKYLKLAVNEFHNLGMIEEEKNYLLELSSLYKLNREFKNALDTYTTANELQDSVTAKSNRKMIAELELKQQLNKKENEIFLLNESNERKSLVGLGLVIFILIITVTSITVLVFYHKKKKQNSLLLETEKKLRSKKIQLEIYQGQLEQLVYERTRELENEISERKKIEEDLVVAKNEAESASNSKSVFLANMSHELRTPLVGILGYSDLMKNIIKDDELKEMADGINRTGNRLLNTVSMVLDLARIESGSNEIKIVPVDMMQEINEVCSGFKGSMFTKKLGFKINLHTETFLLNIDQQMFKVILENLINNAFKFTPKGEICVETFVEAGRDYNNFVVKVKDTGVGIMKEKIPLIFMEFKQLSEGFTKDFQGSGLGLSITKKYVEMLGGKIDVESIFGKGTTFTVKFPVKIQSAA